MTTDTANGTTEVALTTYEMEALRLTDLEGFYQDDAARRMRITPSSMTKILRSAHQKVARALTESNVITVSRDAAEGEIRTYRCNYCDRVWQLPYQAGLPSECPRCHGTQFHIER